VQIFLSHSHQDGRIATALADLIESLFGDLVAVEYSSDESAGDGIGPGEQWLEWITDRIQAADKVYVLLTPASTRKPWVLYESGAAAGVAWASKKPTPVVPITFGITKADVPSPFGSSQVVRGDAVEPGGIRRLLQDLNSALGTPLTPTLFDLGTKGQSPTYLSAVGVALADSAPLETLLESEDPSFPATDLRGHWVTSFEFTSGGVARCHADVAELRSDSDRRVRATNRRPPWTGGPLPAPRTHGRPLRPFLNEIEAELVSRHLIGHWKNLNDTQYLGAIHLGVLDGENVMDGYYTSYAAYSSVGYGPWRWVRIDPGTIEGVDLSALQLGEPEDIRRLISAYDPDAGPLALGTVTKGGS